MNDTSKIVVGIIASVTVLSLLGLGLYKMSWEYTMKAGLTRCYVVGSSYPEWVDSKNCIDVSR